MQTKDSVVNTITTLSAMLGEMTLLKEEAEKAAHAAVDMAAEMSTELENLRRDLSYAEGRARELHDDLARSSARERDSWKLSGKASLFDAFLSNPASMLEAMGYLRDNVTEVRVNKIAAIKRVREIASLGLKEAKDYVEGFLACHPPVDPNPCTDSSLLNG